MPAAASGRLSPAISGEPAGVPITIAPSAATAGTTGSRCPSIPRIPRWSSFAAAASVGLAPSLTNSAVAGS